MGVHLVPPFVPRVASRCPLAASAAIRLSRVRRRCRHASRNRPAPNLLAQCPAPSRMSSSPARAACGTWGIAGAGTRPCLALGRPCRSGRSTSRGDSRELPSANDGGPLAHGVSARKSPYTPRGALPKLTKAPPCAGLASVAGAGDRPDLCSRRALATTDVMLKDGDRTILFVLIETNRIDLSIRSKAPSRPNK